jgi:hypothetical protein
MGKGVRRSVNMEQIEGEVRAGGDSRFNSLRNAMCCSVRCVVPLTACAMRLFQSPTPPQGKRPFDAQINHKSPIWSAE